VRGSYRRTLLAALLAVGVAPALAIIAVTWLVLSTTADVSRARSVILVAGLVLAAAAGAFAWGMAAALAHPLGRLRDGAALMQGPNPTHRVPATPEDGAELAEIGKALNALADQVQAAGRVQVADHRPTAAPANGAPRARSSAGPASTDERAASPDERAAGQQALTLLSDDGPFAPVLPAARAASSGQRWLADLSYAVLDLETTGLDPAGGDRVVSVAVVRVRGGTVERADAFSTLVDPARPIPPTATAIHGITDEQVRGMPALLDVLPELVEYVGEAVLVGHTVTFDLAFLEPALKAAVLPSLRQHGVLDTLLLGHALLPTFRAASLDELAGLLGVVVRDRHTALGDAVTTAEVFVRLLQLLEQHGIVTLDGALALQRPSALREALGGLLDGR
jgi:DNA polymerase III epsilon subunit family exonuclease